MVFLGIILIIVGLLFLLRNFELLPVEIWSAFWPTLLILLGIYIISFTQRVHFFWKRLWDRLWKKLE